MKPNILIIISGGNIQRVVTDQDINLVVIDHDHLGSDYTKEEIENEKSIVLHQGCNFIPEKTENHEDVIIEALKEFDTYLIKP